MRVTTILGCAAVSVSIAGCTWFQPPALTERPVLDALEPPVNVLGACVARRQWGCTTSATRDIVAIMDRSR